MNHILVCINFHIHAQTEKYITILHTQTVHAKNAIKNRFSIMIFSGPIFFPVNSEKPLPVHSRISGSIVKRGNKKEQSFQGQS